MVSARVLDDDSSVPGAPGRPRRPGVASHWYAVPPLAQERILQAAAVLDVRDLVTVWDWPPAAVRQG